jgi:sporulation protein YlmC with PRC-barrel domain
MTVRMAIGAALVTLMALPAGAYAADAAKRPLPKTDAMRSGTDLVETSALIGATVEGMDNKSLGKIDQLLLDRQTGKLHDAVISTGGVGGVGSKKVVVRWSDVRVVDEDGKVVVRTDRAVLDRAPEFDRTALKRERNAERPAASPPTDNKR